MGRTFHRYYSRLEQVKVTFTDLLIWAIMANRAELAKAIWEQTDHPILTALLACQLYHNTIIHSYVLTYFCYHELITQHPEGKDVSTECLHSNFNSVIGTHR